MGICRRQTTKIVVKIKAAETNILVLIPDLIPALHD